MRRLVLVLAAIVLAPVLTSGQWLKYPTEGLPRKADGTPNLDVPTPRPSLPISPRSNAPTGTQANRFHVG